MLARQIKIARKAAIAAAQTPVNAPVLKRAENFPGQPVVWKERQHRAVVGIRRKLQDSFFLSSLLLFRRERALALLNLVDVAVERECVARVLSRFRIKLVKASV